MDADFTPREDEWAAANANFEVTQNTRDCDTPTSNAPPIPFAEASSQLLKDSKGIPVKERNEKASPFAVLFSCFTYEYSKEGLVGRQALLRLAKLNLDNGSTAHKRIFMTIYHTLMSTDPGASDPQMRGRHWEMLGFQGDDPQTDLRATGMLGPLQILFLIDNTRHALKEWFELAVSSTHEFPFVLIGFNFSALSMDVLDTQGMLKACRALEQNGEKDFVLKASCLFYAGCWDVFQQLWQDKSQRTIADFGIIKSEIKKIALKDPFKMFRKGEELLKTAPKLSQSHASPTAVAEFSTI